jgi:hypothetical protein
MTILTHLPEMSVVEVIAAVTLGNMQTDDSVFVLGEEVANLHGGPYKATRGIKEVFPEQPIFAGLKVKFVRCGILRNFWVEQPPGRASIYISLLLIQITNLLRVTHEKFSHFLKI